MKAPDNIKKSFESVNKKVSEMNGKCIIARVSYYIKKVEDREFEKICASLIINV